MPRGAVCAIFWENNERSDNLIGSLDKKKNLVDSAPDAEVCRIRHTIEDVDNEPGQITDKGWVVGFPGGSYSWDDLDVIQVEKILPEQVLGRKVTGYRNHYLRFPVPDSWEYFANAGFEDDTMLGYHEMAGFKNSMWYVSRPYNLYTDTKITILEIPNDYHGQFLI